MLYIYNSDQKGYDDLFFRLISIFSFLAIVFYITCIVFFSILFNLHYNYAINFIDKINEIFYNNRINFSWEIIMLIHISIVLITHIFIFIYLYVCPCCLVDIFYMICIPCESLKSCEYNYICGICKCEKKNKPKDDDKICSNINLQEPRTSTPIHVNNAEINQIDENRSNRRIIKYSNTKEEPIAVIFRSTDGNINYPVAGYNLDNFSKFEKKLFREYPELKKKKIYYLADGKRINKSETMKYNKIKNGAIILIADLI